MKRMVSSILASAGLLAVLIVTGFIVQPADDTLAQLNVETVAELGKVCGEPLYLPEGSVVERAGDFLHVTLPPGYVFAEDEDGRPLILSVSRVDEGLAPDGSSEAVAYMRVIGSAGGVDCDCDGAGQCTEVWNGSVIYCQALASCESEDCTMTVE